MTSWRALFVFLELLAFARCEQDVMSTTLTAQILSVVTTTTAAQPGNATTAAALPSTAATAAAQPGNATTSTAQAGTQLSRPVPSPAPPNKPFAENPGQPNDSLSVAAFVIGGCVLALGAVALGVCLYVTIGRTAAPPMKAQARYSSLT